MTHPEHKLQTAVGKFARAAITVPHYFECYDRSANTDGKRHLWEAARHIKAGTPDTGLIVNGRIYRVELKAPGNEPKPRQWERIHEIRAADGKADWADSVERVGELWEEWGIPLARNWRIQAQHHDARLEAARLKVPTPKKAARPRKEKPSAAALRKVAGIRAKVMF